MQSRWGTAALIQTWSSTPMTTQTVPAACQSMWSSLVPTNSTSTRSSWGRISVPRRTEVSVCSTVYSRGKRGRGVGSSLSRQTGVSVCSPVYRYGWGGGGVGVGVRSSLSRQTEVSVSSPVHSMGESGGSPEFCIKADGGQLTSLQLWGGSQICLSCVTIWRVDCHDRRRDLH